MKKLKTTIHFYWEWWREDGKHLQRDHISELSKHAKKVIYEMNRHNFREGELLLELDSGNGEIVMYKGYWGTIYE